ncbi:uncharacterized protein [Spinacia oleracea]|uniref:Uncharacterized protein isoform X2 n=1 Tax=Spinacia oleracea TaxID=3562 RepID=A0ABM3QIE1_SPIOL|nr:uncharacterized protein LOC130459661 isoform X2 [Spinacia oleracea]
MFSDHHQNVVGNLGLASGFFLQKISQNRLDFRLGLDNSRQQSGKAATGGGSAIARFFRFLDDKTFTSILKTLCFCSSSEDYKVPNLRKLSGHVYSMKIS